ncbi:MAG TPA: N-acetylglucosamine-6-phosphate deacetylase [Ruminiclostridium sp.]
MKYIKGAKIITETQVLKNYVLGFEEKFSWIIPLDEFNIEEAEIINAEGLFIAPGLIDVHIHGSGGKDTMDGTEEALKAISSTIVKNGVTAFLATTMTMEWGKVSNALDQIRKSMVGEMPGAQLMGAHMEGPFINIQFKGAQNSEYIIPPSWDLVKAYKDVIKLVTLAPELPGSEELIKELKKNNIVVSMGHSAASYDEAVKGVDAGVSHCTHLFNAMTGVHHRNPGVASVALATNVYCELIADMIHVHPGLYKLVKKAKGIDRITLITDCIEAGGMVDGTYSLGGQPVIVKNGAARLEDGTLAGSILNLNKGLFNFYKNTNTELFEVFRMASINPAKELGIDSKKGSIAPDKDADFFLMDDEFNVKATYIKGKRIF